MVQFTPRFWEAHVEIFNRFIHGHHDQPWTTLMETDHCQREETSYILEHHRKDAQEDPSRFDPLGRDSENDAHILCVIRVLAISLLM